MSKKEYFSLDKILSCDAQYITFLKRGKVKRMTREEAWRRAKGYLYDALSGEEADEIIRALEQEPCEDAISRHALIERINNAEENFKADHMESIASDDGDAFVNGVLSCVFNIREMVVQAQSVTPAHQKGTNK